MYVHERTQNFNDIEPNLVAQLKSKIDAFDADGGRAYARELGRNARSAARLIAAAGTDIKNRGLAAIADVITQQSEYLAVQNAKDLKSAHEKGLSGALLDRLELTPSRIAGMAEGLRQIVSLPDPVGEISHLRSQPTGIRVGRMRVPLGVVGIIYESRPNVTADAAGLCLKSGNASILRGGSEAIYSNLAIARCIERGLKQSGLPEKAVQVVNVADRSVVGALLTMPECIDVIVPRGGKALIERISREALIPVIKHLDGVCHVYVDDEADIDKAKAIAYNAKTQRYGTCNTMETLLVADAVAAELLPELCEKYLQAGVEIRGCSKTQALCQAAVAAHEEDWVAEYLAPILSIRVVDDLDQAIEHIEQYGSHHTDAIVTENLTHAQRFLRDVDSSSVMVNVSTRFADGFEYGLGAEIGISTDKLHARGPVGLEGLTTQKYIVIGDGQIRT